LHIFCLTAGQEEGGHQMLVAEEGSSVLQGKNKNNFGVGK
jgi:hypothetical protein